MGGSTDYSFIGGNIRRLRRRAGLTQVELSRRIGIQQGPLSLIESGENIPSGRVLFEICKALKVSADTLFSRSRAEFDTFYKQATSFLFRADLDDSHLTKRVSEGVSALMDTILALEDICGAQKRALIQFGIPVDMTCRGIESLARRIRDAMCIRDGVVFDYFELFEIHGLRVVVLPLSKKAMSASFYDAKNENAFFFINNRHNPEKQLFRLAYELGHILLFSWSMKSGHPLRFDQPGGFQDVHHAACKFAALFLMPEHAVRSTVEQLGILSQEWDYELLLRIKHRFGISAESFLYRLDELDLIDPSIVEKLRERIHDHYQETEFSEPDSSRRLLTPNGRIWDLMHVAKLRKAGAAKEIQDLEAILIENKIVKI